MESTHGTQHRPVAWTRSPSPRLGDCELTHLARQAIDVGRAASQHAAYCRILAELGCEVRELDPLPDHPDAVFVEDAAVVFDELAIIARPGAASRRDETRSVERALREVRAIHAIEAPGTIDGGDVLVVGRSVYVGRSSRTNAAAIEQLDRILARHGYTTITVDVHGCLHLKSAATHAGENTILLDPDLVESGVFRGHQILEVAPGEATGANVLLVGETVLCPQSAPGTVQRLAARGLTTRTIAYDEFAKAEGALTCCSLIARR